MVVTHDSTITPIALEVWLYNPPVRTEWVNGVLLQKRDTTLKHSKIQRRLSTLWSHYIDAQGLGGEVYTQVPCQTKQQGRSHHPTRYLNLVIAQCRSGGVKSCETAVGGELGNGEKILGLTTKCSGQE